MRKLWEFEDQGSPYGVDSPIWSPDGRWIAFIMGHDPLTTGSVFAIRPSGGGLRLIMRPITDCLPCSYDPYLGVLSWQALRP